MSEQDQDVIVAFQIWDHPSYDQVDREFLGVFTSLDILQETIDALDQDKSDGSSVFYYIAELDAPGAESQWEEFKNFPSPSAEELSERAILEAGERAARIARNRRDFRS